MKDFLLHTLQYCKIFAKKKQGILLLSKKDLRHVFIGCFFYAVLFGQAVNSDPFHKIFIIMPLREWTKSCKIHKETGGADFAETKRR